MSDGVLSFVQLGRTVVVAVVVVVVVVMHVTKNKRD